MNKEKIEAIFDLLVKVKGEEMVEVVKLFNIGMLTSLNAIIAGELMDKIERLGIGVVH